MHHNSCILSYADRHLKCSEVLAIMNKAFINILICFFVDMLSFPLDNYLGMELMSHRGIYLTI